MQDEPPTTTNTPVRMKPATQERGTRHPVLDETPAPGTGDTPPPSSPRPGQDATLSLPTRGRRGGPWLTALAGQGPGRAGSGAAPRERPPPPAAESRSRLRRCQGNAGHPPRDPQEMGERTAAPPSPHVTAASLDRGHTRHRPLAAGAGPGGRAAPPRPAVQRRAPRRAGPGPGPGPAPAGRKRGLRWVLPAPRPAPSERGGHPLGVLLNGGMYLAVTEEGYPELSPAPPGPPSRSSSGLGSWGPQPSELPL